MIAPRELDISPEYCPLPAAEDLACVSRNAYRRIWVGGSYSPYDVVETYLDAIEGAGIDSGVYGFLHWDDTAKYHLDNALAHVRDARRFLLDVELGDPYGMDPTFVLGRYEWAVDYIRAQGVEPITYTGNWFWPIATNGSLETKGTMLVLADYVHDPDNPPAPDQVPECGGWSLTAGNIYAWQYAGTVDTCNLNTDRILVIKEADMAFDALKRAQQDMATRLLAGDALNDNMASLVSRLVYFGVLPAGTAATRPAIVTETGA